MNKLLANSERLPGRVCPFLVLLRLQDQEVLHERGRQDGWLPPEGLLSLGAGSAQEPRGWWEGFASPKARYQKDLRVERGRPSHPGVCKIPQKSRTGSWLSITKMVTQGFEKNNRGDSYCSNPETD